MPSHARLIPSNIPIHIRPLLIGGYRGLGLADKTGSPSWETVVRATESAFTSRPSVYWTIIITLLRLDPWFRRRFIGSRFRAAI